MPRTRYCETMGHFLMLWPALPQFGRITSDVLTATTLAHFMKAGHIARSLEAARENAKKMKVVGIRSGCPFLSAVYFKYSYS